MVKFAVNLDNSIIALDMALWRRIHATGGPWESRAVTTD